MMNESALLFLQSEPPALVPNAFHCCDIFPFDVDMFGEGIIQTLAIVWRDCLTFAMKLDLACQAKGFSGLNDQILT